jgi:hypothetical protein
MHANRRDELRRKIDEAVRRHAQVEAELCAASAPIFPGDLLLFDVPVDIPLEWAVIFPHPDDAGLWFVVPADQHPMVGSTDVEVPEFAMCGPLTLRCGRGLWIHGDDLDLELRSGRLESEYVDQAREKLSQIVSGCLSSSPFHGEVDADLDYELWLDEIARAVDGLEQRLQCETAPDAVIVRASDFAQDWYENLRGAATAEVPADLAADAGGLHFVPEASAQPPPGAVIASGIPGELVALKYPEGVVVEYLPRGSEEPAMLHREDAAEKRKPLRWMRTPDGNFICGELLRWERDTVVLSIGSGAGREITIER